MIRDLFRHPFGIIPSAFIVAALFNTFYTAALATLFHLKSPVYHSIISLTYSLDAILSWFIPIVNRAATVLAEYGHPDQAELIQNVFSVDWLVSIVALAVALPRIWALHRVLDKGMLDRRSTTQMKGEKSNADEGFHVCLFFFAVSALCSWLGGFLYSGPLVDHLNVQFITLRPYRVCFLAPACLLFGSMCLIVWRLRSKYR